MISCDLYNKSDLLENLRSFVLKSAGQRAREGYSTAEQHALTDVDGEWPEAAHSQLLLLLALVPCGPCVSLTPQTCRKGLFPQIDEDEVDAFTAKLDAELVPET